MAQDAITLSALATELNATLKGGRISKIYMPSDYGLTFLIRKNGEKTLYICADSNTARIHLTTTKFENPVGAPGFCMLLRKHLIGAIIDKVSLFNADRIIAFYLENVTELKDKTKYILLFENFGRYANVLLLKDNLQIVDSLKRITPESSDRVILPNYQYPYQPHNKIRLDEEEKLKNVFDSNIENFKELTQKISGISKTTAKEIFENKNGYNFLKNLCNIYGTKDYLPSLYTIENKVEILPTIYKTLGTPSMTFKTLSECFDFNYKKITAEQKKRAETKQINTIIKRLKDKYSSKIEECQKIVENSEIIEKYRIYGELILANMHLIKNNQSILDCRNYYNNQDIKISLDPLKTAKENAEHYFKKYKKAKRAKEVAYTLISDNLEALNFVENLSISARTSTDKNEYEEILNQLNNLIGKNRNKPLPKSKKKIVQSKCIRLSYNGFTILVGKNNLQNDELTFKTANSTDIWLHVKDFHGSHVVILREGREVPLDVILYAGSLAAKYSEVDTLDKVSVDYTQRKNVRRSGKFAGLVNYTDYKTIIVTPAKID